VAGVSVITSNTVVSIAGTISVAGGNGATVTLSSGTTTVATTTASGAGAYSFNNVSNDSYTVTPANPGFTFTPSSLPVTVSGAGVSGINFNTVVSIAGTISGAGGNGATVTLSSGTTTIATTTASGAGAYSFNNVSNGSFTVTPTNAGFTFTPLSLPVTVSGTSVSGVNFSTVASIAGTI